MMLMMVLYDIFVSLEIVRQDMREKIMMRVRERERERAGDMKSVGWFFAFSFFCSMSWRCFWRLESRWQRWRLGTRASDKGIIQKPERERERERERGRERESRNEGTLRDNTY